MKSFEIFNIKGFVDSGEIDVKPLTIFIGKNSSGKSSLGRFLVVLKQTFFSLKDSPLVFFDDDRNFIDYGEFKDIVYNNETENEMGFSLTINKDELIRSDNYSYAVEMGNGMIDYGHKLNLLKKYLNAVEHLKIEVFMKKIDKKLVVTSFKCICGEENVLIDLKLNDNEQYSMKIFGEDTVYNLSEDAVMFENFLPHYRIFDFQYAKWKQEKIMFLYELFYCINMYLKKLAKGIEYIGPFREAPQRYYRSDEDVPDFVGIKGEFAPIIIEDDYKNGGEVINEISQWMEKNLKVRLSVEDKDGRFSIMLKDTNNSGIKNNLMDVGYGMAQLIPILVEVFNKKSINRSKKTPSITLIEQPELHLHPSAQASLADLFLNSCSSGRRYIVETHSENLILRLRRRLVENPDLRKNVGLYYIEKQKEGNSSVRRLFMNDSGDIENWPKGLLSEDFYELVEIKKAAKKNNDDSARGEFTW